MKWKLMDMFFFKPQGKKKTICESKVFYRDVDSGS